MEYRTTAKGNPIPAQVLKGCTIDELDQFASQDILLYLSNCTFEYTFDYQIFELPYPEKSHSRGLCIYRKYEPNPMPQPVTSSNLLIATNQALLGRVPPNVRQITLTYDEKNGHMTIFACFDIDPSPSQVQNIDAILIEMKSHFSDDITWSKEIFVVPFPAKFSMGERGLYERFEPDQEV